MGFQAPLHDLSEYLAWTGSGKLQLPDFQRGYKWDDERIRSLLVSILQGHPLGVVMMLQTGNDQVRFKPRPVEGVEVDGKVEPDWLLLDGQQRLTSLTQALTGDGVVDTMDDRGKKLERKYYIDIATALHGEEAMDDAVRSIPGDGRVTENFGRDVILDVSTPEQEREQGLFPLSLLFSDEMMSWFFKYGNQEVSNRFFSDVAQKARAYKIPAIELDRHTSKAAVATVFEKVNTGGLPLNVFELLTATFAGDGDYYRDHGVDFRLNDDWQETQKRFKPYPVLKLVENTDFLQAVTLLATRKRNLADHTGRAPRVSARREDILKLTLDDYLEWVEPLRDGFIWAADFLADRHIFEPAFVPYSTQLVPLAAIKVVMGHDADLLGPSERLARWFWCGILGELYGGASATRFVRDLEQVPVWAMADSSTLDEAPNTVRDAAFAESRLLSLRTRNSAAYKGIYALLLDRGARDWMEDKDFGKVQYSSLNTDIHHIFPKRWCAGMGISNDRMQSIVNKTAISSRTNRVIGGAAPSRYLETIEQRAQIEPEQLDGLLEGHLVDPIALRSDDFDLFFDSRREALCALIEDAMEKTVQRDIAEGRLTEGTEQFLPEVMDDDSNGLEAEGV